MRAAACSRCCIAVLSAISAKHVDALRHMTRFAREVRLIVVTMPDHETTRRLHGLDLQAILWFNEVEQRLAAAIADASLRGSHQLMVAQVRSASAVPPRLRNALEFTLLQGTVRLSVHDLAVATSCHRATLAKQWRSVEGSERLGHLQDVLDGLLLLTALRRKSPGRSWEAVATELRVHSHTLHRTARRQTGSTLRELEAAGYAAAAAQFAADLAIALRAMRSEAAAERRPRTSE